MARKSTRRPAPAATRTQFQPQDLLLAGIGAVALGRKQIGRVYANGFEGIAELRDRAQDAAYGVAQSLNGTALALRKQAVAKVAPVRKQLGALAAEAQAQARTKVAPLLARLGIKAAAVKKRAPARKKPARSRSRKAA